MFQVERLLLPQHPPQPLPKVYNIQPARKAQARRACGLRAVGLLLADSAPQWGGGRLFDGSTGTFYENGRNSGTESQKFTPEVGNERSHRGLQMNR